MRNNWGVPQLRIALAQINHTVGDVTGNLASVLAHTAQAAAAGAHLVCFPEMMLTGYPPEDLVFRASFRAASQSALLRLATELLDAGLGETAIIVGYLDDDGAPRNAAAFVHRGAVVARYYKHHLPNYGVFDEQRYFRRGDQLSVVRYRGIDIALTICEDAWQEGGPFAQARAAGVDLVVNINGSPYERNKDDIRLPLLQRRAIEAGAAIAYVNTVGAQDELVFDGDSFIVDAAGRLLSRAPQYESGVFCTDLVLPARDGATPPLTPAPAAGPVEYPPMWVERYLTAGGEEPVAAYRPTEPTVAAAISDEAEVWGALVLGVRDYATKNGFGSIVIAISGGIDSAVVAAIAADAIGGANVYGVSLPSAYSSEHSKSDAADLAQRLGAHYREVPIAAMVTEFVESLKLTGVAEENVQARVRGTTLMALSNAEGHLVLATGNKSELAVGYSTIYGDAVGGYAPIKDVPKSLVWTLARWRNELAESRGEVVPIPPDSITKAPSAELRPGQLDSDSLPDYELLDALIARYVDADASVTAIIAEGFDVDLVRRIAKLVDTAEWKRRQYPPGPKISFKAFGRDRRLPITNRWREV